MPPIAPTRRGLVRSSLRRRGGILLEVVLAMVLFFSAGAVILAGLGSAIRGMEQLRLDAQAADLAITLMSRLQIGDLELTDAGPSDFEPIEGPQQELDGWTWQVITSQMQDTIDAGGPTGKLVQVIVRNEPKGYSYRLSQWLATDESGQVLTAASQPAQPKAEEAQP